MWPFSKKVNDDTEPKKKDRSVPDWYDQPKEESGPRASRVSSSFFGSSSPNTPSKPQEKGWLDGFSLFGGSSDPIDKKHGASAPRQPSSALDKIFPNKNRDNPSYTTNDYYGTPDNDEDSFLFAAAESVRKNRSTDTSPLDTSSSSIAKHLNIGSSRLNQSHISPQHRSITSTDPPTPYHIKSRGTLDELHEQTVREKESAQFFDQNGRFNPTKDITKRYINPDEKRRQLLQSEPTTAHNFVDTSDTRTGMREYKLTDAQRARVRDLEEQHLEDERAADEALWAQKDRTLHAQLQRYAQDNNVDIDTLEENRTQNKKFHKFDVTEGTRSKIDKIFSQDVEGIEMPYVAGTKYDGVPGAQQTSQNIDIPSNHIYEGKKLIVIPPKALSPREYADLSDTNKQKYQQQQIDFQRFSFQQMPYKQQELMLIAQWDKLSPQQQHECLEFQYLHLNHNTRRQVKHMSESQKNSFLREKHIEQQRLFLSTPVNHDAEKVAEDMLKAGDEHYFEGKKGQQGKKKRPLLKTSYDDFIAGGESDEELDFNSLEQMSPKEKITFEEALKKFNDLRNEKRQLSDEEFFRAQKRLRELQPQQQFSILFRQHEKQRLQLERYQDNQMEKFTHDLMRKLQTDEPNITITPQFLLNHSQVKEMRKQQQEEKDVLRQRQEDEHAQLTKFLLYQQEATDNMKKLLDERNAENNPRMIDNALNSFDEEIETTREQLIDDLHKQRRQRDTLALEWDLDDELKEKMGLSRVQGPLGLVDLLDRYKPKDIKPISISKTKQLVKERNMNDVIAKQRLSEDIEMEAYMEGLRQRRRNMLLFLPINNNVLEVHHPIVRNRRSDAICSKIYKLTSMFLFGVNVRWNDGVVNGIFSKLTPPIPRDSKLAAQYKHIKPIFLDIEHRKLDFGNLANYYGVAASLYNSDCMPIFSHRLYEDPDLNPFDNPNIAPLQRFEQLSELRKRAQQRGVTVQQLLNNPRDDDIPAISDTFAGPIGESSVEHMKTSDLLSVLVDTLQPSFGKDTNPLLLPHASSVEIIKTPVGSLGEDSRGVEENLTQESKQMLLLSDDPMAMQKAIKDYHERLQHEIDADTQLRLAGSESMKKSIQSGGLKYIADKEAYFAELNAQRDKEERRARELDESARKRAVEQEKEKLRQQQRETVRARKDEIRAKREAETQVTGTTGHSFSNVPITSREDALDWNRGDFSRSNQRNQKMLQMKPHAHFQHEYAQWDGVDPDDERFQSPKPRTSIVNKRKLLEEDTITHHPHDDEDNYALVHQYEQRSNRNASSRADFGSWNDTIDEIELNKDGYDEQSSKFLTFTEKSPRGGPNILVPILSPRDVKVKHQNDWSETDEEEESSSRFKTAAFDPKRMVSNIPVLPGANSRDSIRQSDQSKDPEKKGWFDKLFG